jgi:transcriptional regulator with XRE-family HTH domain
MPYGAQKEVADALGASEPYVSQVMSDAVHPKTEAAQKRLRETQEALAARLGLPVEDVFDVESEAVGSTP